MIVGSHILGIPVEENIPYVIPFLGGGITVWGYYKWRFKKCQCGKRGCICGGDQNTI